MANKNCIARGTSVERNAVQPAGLSSSPTQQQPIAPISSSSLNQTC